MNYLLYISIITVLFIIYVEYSVGGILWRQTSSGVKSFNFGPLSEYSKSVKKLIEDFYVK